MLDESEVLVSGLDFRLEAMRISDYKGLFWLVNISDYLLFAYCSLFMRACSIPGDKSCFWSITERGAEP